MTSQLRSRASAAATGWVLRVLLLLKHSFLQCKHYKSYKLSKPQSRMLEKMVCRERLADVACQRHH